MKYTHLQTLQWEDVMSSMSTVVRPNTWCRVFTILSRGKSHRQTKFERAVTTHWREFERLESTELDLTCHAGRIRASSLEFRALGVDTSQDIFLTTNTLWKVLGLWSGKSLFANWTGWLGIGMNVYPRHNSLLFRNVAHSKAIGGSHRFWSILIFNTNPCFVPWSLRNLARYNWVRDVCDEDQTSRVIRILAFNHSLSRHLSSFHLFQNASIIRDRLS